MRDDGRGVPDREDAGRAVRGGVDLAVEGYPDPGAVPLPR